MQYSFGVDVGGTTVKLGLFENDRLIEKTEIVTRTQNGGERILPDIAKKIDEICRARQLEKADVRGVGVGVPGPIDARGTVNRCVNLNWGVFNLHDALGALTGLRVVGGNDANCAALGEFYDGGGAGADSVLFLTLGTGVGGGVILNGKILGGAHGCGGEIGHITVSAPDKAPCTCGKFGCLEQYASANGIVRVCRQRLAEFDGRTVLTSAEPLTCKAIFDAAKYGDAFAVRTLDTVFDYLGEALASACCVCDPECVILGGGVSRAGEYLLSGTQRAFERHRFHACAGTKFALATLGNDAGMYGANRLTM